jgi:hypothetical protein
MTTRRRPSIEAPRRPSVFDEVVAGAVATGPGAEPAAPPEPAPAPAVEPEDEPAEAQDADADAPAEDGPAVSPAPQAPRPRRPRSRLPLPAALANAGATKPLQAKLPLQVHWDFKVATFAQGRDMSDAVEALISIYTEDPATAERLIKRAEEQGVTLGELLHDALRATAR